MTKPHVMRPWDRPEEPQPKEGDPEDFNIGHLNIDSITGKKRYLQHILETGKYDIFGITEVKYSRRNHLDIPIDGYHVDIYPTSFGKNACRGTAIYINLGLIQNGSIESRQSSVRNGIEIADISLNILSQLNVTFLYRPHKPYRNRNDLKTLLATKGITWEQHRPIVMGDMNIKWNREPFFIDGMQQLIRAVTRSGLRPGVRPLTGTTIDHIWIADQHQDQYQDHNDRVDTFSHDTVYKVKEEDGVSMSDHCIIRTALRYSENKPKPELNKQDLGTYKVHWPGAARSRNQGTAAAAVAAGAAGAAGATEPEATETQAVDGDGADSKEKKPKPELKQQDLGTYQVHWPGAARSRNQGTAAAAAAAMTAAGAAGATEPEATETQAGDGDGADSKATYLKTGYLHMGEDAAAFNNPWDTLLGDANFDVFAVTRACKAESEDVPDYKQWSYYISDLQILLFVKNKKGQKYGDSVKVWKASYAETIGLSLHISLSYKYEVEKYRKQVHMLFLKTQDQTKVEDLRDHVQTRKAQVKRGNKFLVFGNLNIRSNQPLMFNEMIQINSRVPGYSDQLWVDRQTMMKIAYGGGKNVPQSTNQLIWCKLNIEELRFVLPS